MHKLLDLAEDNPELTFDTVFFLCLKDEQDRVREKAIAGLWECEERSLATTLIRMLQCDAAPNVRAAAAQALGRFVDLAQEGKTSSREQERLRDALLTAAKDDGQPQEVRRRALESCAAINALEVTVLIRGSYASGDTAVRASAIFAMGRNGDPAWLPVIVKELGSSAPEMRFEAAAACGQLGEPHLVPKLLPLLRDTDAQVRLATVEALGSIGGPLARKVLQTELKSDDEPIRDAAEQALQHIQLLEDPLLFRSLP
ncbi:MAG: HEAT repeat domain-containing protein [SAR202 cluster bacterium]|nr:HEAT repeat domain-containing protein [SAR202 cluster bacterium]